MSMKKLTDIEQRDDANELRTKLGLVRRVLVRLAAKPALNLIEGRIRRQIALGYVSAEAGAHLLGVFRRTLTGKADA